MIHLSSSYIFIKCLVCLTLTFNTLLASAFHSSTTIILTRSFTLYAFQTESMNGSPIPINSAFHGLRKVHVEPDFYIIENFLDTAACENMHISSSIFKIMGIKFLHGCSLLENVM